MKNNLTIPSLILMALASPPLVSNASDNFETGDLAAVFYPVTGTAPTTLGPQYFVFNLGPASLYRENTQNDVPVGTVNPLITDSNIATDLAAVFGPTWASDGILRIFVTTTIPVGTSNLVNGDPATTIYSSVPRTSLDNGSTGPGVSFPTNTYNFSSLRNSSSGDIRPFIYEGTNSAIAKTGGYTNSNPTVAPFGNPFGVRLPMSGNLINLSLYVPPATSTYFKIGTNPAAITGPGTLPGTAGVEGAVAMFRVLSSLTDTTGAPADLTSGSSSGNATVGVPQYIGSLSLTSAGLLKVQAVGVAAPPAGSYTTWATARGIPGEPASGDFDNDGISNLVEYALGTNPKVSSQPAGVYSGSTITFTKGPDAIANGDVSWVIETSQLLTAGSWTPQVTQAAGNAAATISYPLTPGSPAKNFARLKVVKNP